MSETMHNLESKIIAGGVLKVEAPKVNSSDWLIKREESLRPEKKDFVLKAFNKRFPDIKVKDADQVYNLCSRSKLLNEWLSNTNLLYVDQVKIPAYAIDLLDTSKVKECYEIITEINDKNSLKAAAIKALSDTFKENLRKIEDNKDYKCDKQLTNEVKVLILNTTDLPLTLQLAIENFTPAKNDEFPDTRAYAREMLFQFKKSLFKLIKEKPEINIDNVINELKEK